MLQGAQLSGTGRSSAVGDYFREKGLKRSDIELIIAGLPDALAAHKIRTVAAPGYTERPFVDEDALREALERNVRYRSDGTMQHDLDAIVAVHRLRGGRTQELLEESKAIFLTTNTKLVAASREFFRLDEDRFSWPHAISDTVLATLMWLKKPMRAPDLPRKQILADCYAALRPNQGVWNQWLHEIERVAKSGSYTDAQLDIMRYSPEAQRALMDMTFGDPGAVDDRIVGEVLAAAASTITAPVVNELNAERVLAVRKPKTPQRSARSPSRRPRPRSSRNGRTATAGSVPLPIAEQRTSAAVSSWYFLWLSCSGYWRRCRAWARYPDRMSRCGCGYPP